MEARTVSLLRDGLPPLPPQMTALPVDKRGYPVPWFVRWIDGEPDFRVLDSGKLAGCIRDSRCWICGNRLGRFATFVVGPMCAVNRTSAEPPSHVDCAVFAVKACPFIRLPKAQRRDAPEGASSAGIMIERNPGVALLWTTHSYSLLPTSTGLLCKMGDPLHVQWYAEGRTATRAEALASMESGLPILKSMAEAGTDDLEVLQRMYEAALKLLPAEGAGP